MPKSRGQISSPFETSTKGSIEKKLADDERETKSPRKRPRVETPPLTKSSPRAPTQTPRTAARYGVPHEEVQKIAKKATNFKELMTVIAELIAWAQQNPDFTDGELSRQVIKVFQEANVLSWLMPKLIVRRQNVYSLN